MSDFIDEFQTSLESRWAVAPRDGDIEKFHITEDLETLLKDLTAMDVALKATPINLTKGDIHEVKEEVHAYTISYVKVASTFKNLPSPLSSEEGLTILPILQAIQTKFVELMNECALRLPQAEADTPGYGKFFSDNIRNLVDPYYDSLALIAPLTIPQSLVQEMKSVADTAIQNAIVGLPGV